jgi:peptide/nickel transport system substrate-binding protein
MMPRTRYQLHRLVLLSVLLVIAGACAAADSSPAPQPAASKAPELPADVITSEAERRRTVIWDIPSGQVDNPAQWNPFARDARRDKGFHQSMIEPLFILNYESGVIEPWLGEQMTANAAQDIWTLTLREGVRWSDGEAFTADDVVFTTNLVLDNPELELDFFAGFSSWVERVEKIDDRTVRFVLTGSNPRFQLDFFSVKVWGSFDILPEHIWHDKDPLTFTNYDPAQGWPVFTGPYTLESFSDNTFIYVRDDDWWGAEAGFKPLPAPERMIWASINIGNDVRAATEHLDSIGNVGMDTFQAISAVKPNLITWLDGIPFAWMDPCSRTLSFNTMQPPWDDKALRWAVNYAIDRAEIVEDAYYATTTPSRHFFPAYPPLERYVQLLEQAGLYEEYPLITHDPARAQQLIEAQGWSQGSDGYYHQGDQQLALTIYAHEASPEMRRTAELVAEHLQTIGVNAQMPALPESEWVENKTYGYFEAMIDWDTCGSINEPWASLDRFHMRWAQPIGTPVSNYNNQVRWQNAEYSAIVDEMAPLPLGDPRIDELFVEASAIWLEELPFIPLVQNKQLISFDTTYWHNWPTTNNAYVHPPSWWQSVHIIIHHLEPAEQ